MSQTSNGDSRPLRNAAGAVNCISDQFKLKERSCIKYHQYQVKNTLSLPVENRWFCLTLRVIGLVGAEALL